MTLSQGYREAQAAMHPYLDYPYISIPDEDEDEVLTDIQIGYGKDII